MGGKAAHADLCLQADPPALRSHDASGEGPPNNEGGGGRDAGACDGERHRACTHMQGSPPLLMPKPVACSSPWCGGISFRTPKPEARLSPRHTGMTKTEPEEEVVLLHFHVSSPHWDDAGFSLPRKPCSRRQSQPGVGSYPRSLQAELDRNKNSSSFTYVRERKNEFGGASQ